MEGNAEEYHACMLQVTTLRDSVGAAVIPLGRGARRGCGLVVAADQVVAMSHSLSSEQPELRIAGEVREGAVERSDRTAGLSLIAVATGEITPITWADDAPQLGDVVFALGDPGTGLRVTEGRVSAGPLSLRGRGGRLIDGIEHTAPLPRGSGGGPLVDPDGAVVGVNALRGDAGFLLALPARAVQSAVERIVEGREPARLGVALASPSASRRMRRAVGLPDHDGLLVQGVEDASAADRAGVARGDLLVSLAGAPLATIDDLHSALDANSSAPAIELGVLRATEQLQLSVDLRGRAK